MKAPSRSRLKGISLSVGVVAALLLTLLGMYRVIEAGGQTWAAAVQGAATVALVGVTAFYAFLTYRILRVQERQVAEQGHQEAVRRLIETLSDHSSVLGVAANKFPLPYEDIERATFSIDVDEVEELANGVGRLAFTLPNSLNMKAVASAYLLQNLLAGLFRLRESICSIRRDAAQADVSKIKGYYDKVGTKGPSWEELASGRVLKRAHDSIDDLRKAAYAYMQGQDV